MEIRRTQRFTAWLSGLKDRVGVAKILIRIDRLVSGNPGSTRNLGAGLGELKIDFGPGYRVYFLQRGSAIVILLCGGDKDTQARDIEIARAMAEELSKEL